MISPVASVVVMLPLRVNSTKLAPLSTSSCVAVPAVAVAPFAATRLTLRLIVPSVRSSASVTKIEPVVVLALSVPTAVSRWLLLAPIAAPAVTSSLAAVTSTAFASDRSSTLPEASNATLPAPAAIWPTVTSPPSACTRTSPPALVITAPSTIATLPASTSKVLSASTTPLRFTT